MNTNIISFSVCYSQFTSIWMWVTVKFRSTNIAFKNSQSQIEHKKEKGMHKRIFFSAVVILAVVVEFKVIESRPQKEIPIVPKIYYIRIVKLVCAFNANDRSAKDAKNEMKGKNWVFLLCCCLVCVCFGLMVCQKENAGIVWEVEEDEAAGEGEWMGEQVAVNKGGKKSAQTDRQREGECWLFCWLFSLFVCFWKPILFLFFLHSFPSIRRTDSYLFHFVFVSSRFIFCALVRSFRHTIYVYVHWARDWRM